MTAAMRLRLAVIVFIVAFACAIPHPRADARVGHPFRGITYIDRSETSPRPLHMHIAQIDLATPGLRFRLSPPKPPLEVVRQTTLAFLKEAHAQVAINAHFFWPWPSDEPASSLVGIAASDGTVYSAFEHPIQRYAIVDEAPGLNIDRENRAAIVHHDPASRDATRIVEAVTLWNTVSGSAQIVTQGEVTVPEYRDAQHPGGLLEPGGPGDYSKRAFLVRRARRTDGDRTVARCAHVDAVHRRRARRERRHAIDRGRARADERLRRLERAQSRRRRLDVDGHGRPLHRNRLDRERVLRQSRRPARRQQPRRLRSSRALTPVCNLFPRPLLNEVEGRMFVLISAVALAIMPATNEADWSRLRQLKHGAEVIVTLQDGSRPALTQMSHGSSQRRAQS